MRSPFALGCALLAALASRGADATTPAPEFARRFFDFTPVSAENPVVATIDGTVQIPLSELRGYRDAERPRTITDPANLAQKRAVLDDLVNEYLYVDDAYRAGVPESAAFSRRMDATRTMLLSDFMSVRAIETKPLATMPDREAAAAMAEKLFDAANIEVSNEAYDLLKKSAFVVDQAAENSPQLAAVVKHAPDATLVRYEDRTISVHQILAIYAGLPVAKRPRVATEAGLIAMIKPLIAPELMALEAAKRGIAAEPAFQHKLIQNRNALLRFHVHGAIESQANAVLNGPDLEPQLAAWYRTHAEFYATPATSGGKTIPTLAAVRDRALADFSVDLRDRLLAEKAQALRRERHVAIDEKALQAL